jgi:hypothetical protein
VGTQPSCGRIPAAAANNNGRDLLEMGIYLDCLPQVQMASVSEECG